MDIMRDRTRDHAWKTWPLTLRIRDIFDAYSYREFRINWNQADIVNSESGLEENTGGFSDFRLLCRAHVSI